MLSVQLAYIAVEWVRMSVQRPLIRRCAGRHRKRVQLEITNASMPCGICVGRATGDGRRRRRIWPAARQLMKDLCNARKDRI